MHVVAIIIETEEMTIFAFMHSDPLSVLRFRHYENLAKSGEWIWGAGWGRGRGHVPPVDPP